MAERPTFYKICGSGGIFGDNYILATLMLDGGYLLAEMAQISATRLRSGIYWRMSPTVKKISATVSDTDNNGGELPIDSERLSDTDSQASVASIRKPEEHSMSSKVIPLKVLLALTQPLQLSNTESKTEILQKVLANVEQKLVRP